MKNPRLDYSKAAPGVYEAMDALDQYLQTCGLEKPLIFLVQLRASQINGCAYCIGMHTNEALSDGEPVERLTLLDAWSESSLYSDKERAALQWIEEVTLIADTAASDEAYDKLKTQFSDDEIVWLTTAATLINAWNRIAISSRIEYRAPHRSVPHSAQPAEVA